MAAFVDEMLRELPGVLAALERTADDLVVYVGPVADERHFPTRPPQEPHHDVEGGQHPRMADVREVVDGDPAHVDADASLANGSEVLLLVGKRVEDAQRHGTLLPEPARRLRSTAAARGAAATLHDPAVETGLRANQQLKMVFRSPSMSSSLTPLASESSLIKRFRAVSSILRSPKLKSLSNLSR